MSEAYFLQLPSFEAGGVTGHFLVRLALGSAQCGSQDREERGQRRCSSSSLGAASKSSPGSGNLPVAPSPCCGLNGCKILHTGLFLLFRGIT